MSALSTGIGTGITYGFEPPPYDTVNIASRLWHMRADSVTVGGGSTTATDLSGAGHDLVNSGVGTTQPTLTAFPGASAPSLYFDGGDQLNCSTAILPVTVGAIYTLIYVVTFDDTAARIAVSLTTGSGGLACGQSVSGANTLVWKVGGAFDNGPAAVSNTPQWIAEVFKVGAAYTSKMYVNGAIQSTTASTLQVLAPVGTGFGLGRYINGNAFFHKGHFAEGLLISGDASALVPQISTYMVSRYGTSG